MLNRINAVLTSASIAGFLVDAGQRAIIFDQFQGVKAEVKKEGTHFYIPYLQRPIKFDVRMKPRIINTVTGTRDLQEVTVALRVLSRPDVPFLKEIYQQLGVDYDERVLPSIGNEIMKSVIAQYDAESLLTNREKVSKEIRDHLINRGSGFHILFDDISIIHLEFSKEFALAIEKKQVAQQEAERSKFVVMKSEQERLAAVIRAEAEAEAADLVSKAFKTSGRGLLDIRRLETAIEMAENLSKNGNVVYLPKGSNMLMQMDPASRRV